VNTFTCDHCGKPINYETQHFGQTASCPHCEQLVAIPDAEGRRAILPRSKPGGRPLWAWDAVGSISVLVALLFGAGSVLAWLIAIGESDQRAPLMLICGLLCLVILSLERIRLELADNRQP
jgi:hypothetical protein